MPFKRYGKKKSYPTRRRAYRRSRFSRKRFNKYSSSQKTVIRAPINARELYVKLPYQLSFNSAWPAGGTTWAFLGNSLCPVPTSYASSAPATGNVWAAGVQEHASFYERYRVLGSSINIRMVMLGTSNTFRFVLLPIMAGGEEGTGSSNVAARITELDALTYDQLSVQPYAQARSVGISTGSNAFISFKMFRKTKQMLAARNVKDIQTTTCEMPDSTGANGSILVDGANSFFYYLRGFNNSGSAANVDIQVRMKFYTQIFGRSNWVPMTVP